MAFTISRITRRRFSLSVAALAMLVPTTAGFASQPATIAVSGELLYLQRIALPETATAVVELKADNAADGASVAAEFRETLNGRQVPISFQFEVDGERLEHDTKYVVRGAIYVNDRLEWLSDEAPVEITGNSVDVGTLSLRPHKASAPFDLTAPDEIQNIEWKISSFGETPAIDGLTFTLGSDGNFFGKACNNVRGSYTIEPGTISFGNAAVTMMACSEPLMTQERLLFDALEKAAHFQLTDEGELTLQDASGAILVTAKR